MLLRDYYMAQSIFKKNSAKYGQGPKAFYDKNDGIQHNFSMLNTINIPSQTAILNYQRQQASNLGFFRGNKDVFLEINTFLNQNNLQTEDLSQTINTFTEKINKILIDYDNKNSLGGFYNTKLSQKNSQDLLNLINHNSNLINELANLISELDKLSITGGSALWALNQLKRVLNDLKIDYEKAKTLSTFNLTGSYLMNLHRIASILIGEYGEQKGYEFIKKHLPTNLKIISTGSIHLPMLDIFGQNIVGSGKLYRSDLVVYDTQITDNVQIEWSAGERHFQDTLTNFFTWLENNKEKETISFSSGEEMQKLIRNVYGIQSKMNKGTINFLKRNKSNKGRVFTLSTIISNESSNTCAAALKQLNLLTINPYRARITKTHTDYNALFNYCLGKYLLQIIGVENQIILTNKGLQNIQDWLIDEFNKGKIMYASTKIHIDQADRSIGISFGINNKN